MKRVLLLGCLFFALHVRANEGAADSGQSQDNGISYTVAERGPHSRVMQRTTYETGPDGQQIPQVHNYTELATGMHYQDASGQWVESKAEINILPNGAGAAATNGQHKAIFPPDLYNGQIELNTPDGKWLRSQVLGLSYFDTASGQSVLIAETTNSAGQLASSNIVIYPDAFTGFSADVRYTYTRAGFEQDIVLRQQPPSPEAYGLNPDTTHLQVLTEFFSPPVPTRRIQPLQELQDEALDFGVMKIGRGKAFALGDESTNRVANPRNSIPVSKKWLELEGRDFLVEEVQFKKVEPKLESLLPAPVAVNRKFVPPTSALHRVVAGRILPAPRLNKLSTNAFQMAEMKPKFKPGYVLDYFTVNGASDFTFRGDTTYYVSSGVSLYGTTTFEGGAVIKYNGSGQIDLYDTVVCKTGPYRPTIFTSHYDDSVGEHVASGTPAYGDVMTFLNLQTSCKLHYLRFYDASQAVNDFGGSCDLELWNCVFVNTDYAVTIIGANLSLYNVLIEQPSGTGDNALWTSGCNVLLEHVTTANAQNSPVYDDGGSSTVTSRNCLEFREPPVGPASGVFQTVGAGNFYLVAGSTNRDVGTTNITLALLAELRQKTTHPPILLSNITVSADTLLIPQAQRDTDQPDLGYHYDPIDYFCDLYTVTNATLTVTNGTVIAYDNVGKGIYLRGGSIVSVGTPLAPNRIIHYATAQEQSVGIGGTNSSLARAVYPLTSSQYCRGIYKFTQFSLPATDGYHLFHATTTAIYSNLLVQDCEFWNGKNDLSGTANSIANIRNNLFNRTKITASAASAASSLSFSNNLFFGIVSITLVQGSAAVWHAFNNSFDTCKLVASTCTNGYNAYINCTNRITPNYGSDVTITNFIFTYNTGLLGDFYQNSTNLFNIGANAANQIGLYHYTTTTNQWKETNSIVDIGYHYVALNTNGVPFDTDGDGTPDYLEDANGNGSTDSGEADWQSYNSPNGLTNGSGLQVYTPLK